jgi:hypothetical protein
VTKVPVQRETRVLKEIRALRETKGLKDLKESKAIRALKVLRGTRVLKAIRVPKGTKEIRVPKGTKGIRVLKGIRALKVIKVLRATKGMREIRALKGIRVLKENKATRDHKAHKVTKDLKENKATKVLREIKVIKVRRDPKVTRDHKVIRVKKVTRERMVKTENLVANAQTLFVQLNAQEEQAKCSPKRVQALNCQLTMTEAHLMVNNLDMETLTVAFLLTTVMRTLLIAATVQLISLCLSLPPTALLTLSSWLRCVSQTLILNACDALKSILKQPLSVRPKHLPLLCCFTCSIKKQESGI